MSVFNENGILVKSSNNINSVMEDFKLLQNNISYYPIHEAFDLKKIWNWIIEKLAALKDLIIKAFNFIKSKFKKYNDSEINKFIEKNYDNIIDTVRTNYQNNNKYTIKSVNAYDNNSLIESFKYVKSLEAKDYNISMTINLISKAGAKYITKDDLFMQYLDDNKDLHPKSKFTDKIDTIINNGSNQLKDVDALEFIDNYYDEFKNRFMWFKKNSKEDKDDNMYTFKYNLLATTNTKIYDDAIAECKKYIRNEDNSIKEEYVNYLKSYLNKITLISQMYVSIVDYFSDKILKIYAEYNKCLYSIANNYKIKLN